MRLSFIPLLFLALPLIEIAGFVIVGRQIGVFPTLGLIIASGIAGIVLLRYQGLGVLNRIRQDSAAGRDPGREMAHGVMIAMAGILLLIPGFFTDIIGLLLFIPPIRDLGWKLIRSRVTVSTGFGPMGARPSRQRNGKTIDLDAQDYSRGADPASPWRRIDED